MYYETFISVDLVEADTIDSVIWFNGLPYIPLSASASILELDQDGIKSALAVSFFTDRRQPFSGNEPKAPDDRRGWWGDTTLEPGDRIGSRLWMLARSPMISKRIIPDAEAMLKESYKWMLEDGVVDSMKISVSRLDNYTLGFSITVKKPNDTKTSKYDFLWRALQEEAA